MALVTPFCRQCKGFMRSLDAADGKMSKLKENLLTLEKSLHKSYEVNSSLISKISTLETQVEFLKQQKEVHVSVANDFGVSLVSEIHKVSELESEISELQASIAKSEDNCAALQASFANYQASSALLQASLDASHALLAKSEDSIANYQASSAVLQAANDGLQTEFANYQDALVESQTDSSKNQLALDCLYEKYAELHSKYGDSQANLHVAHAALGESRVELADLQCNFGMLKAEREKLQTELSNWIAMDREFDIYHSETASKLLHNKTVIDVDIEKYLNGVVLQSQDIPH